VADSIRGSIDEKVWTNPSRAKCGDLLNHIFPDFFLVLLFFEGFSQTCLELFGAEHLSSFGRCVLGFDVLLSNFFLISARLIIVTRSSLLFLCHALRVQSLDGARVLDQELSNRRG
jgi:hypothetical protein